jgi:hypothetical protein
MMACVACGSSAAIWKESANVDMDVDPLSYHSNFTSNRALPSLPGEWCATYHRQVQP